MVSSEPTQRKETTCCPCKFFFFFKKPLSSLRGALRGHHLDRSGRGANSTARDARRSVYVLYM